MFWWYLRFLFYIQNTLVWRKNIWVIHNLVPIYISHNILARFFFWFGRPFWITGTHKIIKIILLMKLKLTFFMHLCIFLYFSQKNLVWKLYWMGIANCHLGFDSNQNHQYYLLQCQNWKCNRQHHIDWSDISGKNYSNEMIF